MNRVLDSRWSDPISASVLLIAVQWCKPKTKYAQFEKPTCPAILEQGPYQKPEQQGQQHVKQSVWFCRTGSKWLASTLLQWMKAT